MYACMCNAGNETHQCYVFDVNESTESIPDTHMRVPTPFSLVKRKSASDTNLNLVSQPETFDTGSKVQSSLTDYSTKYEAASIEDCETMIFHPAGKKSVAMAAYSPVEKTPCPSRCMSPNPAVYSSTVEGDNLLPDSLNSSTTEPVPSTGEPIHISDAFITLPSSRELKNPISNAFEAPTVVHSTHPAEICQEKQPSYVCVEDSDTSTTDSLDEGNLNAYPLSSRFQTGNTSHELFSNHKDKIVGILKKGNRSHSVPLAYYSRSRAPYSGSTSSETLNQGDNGNSSKLQKKVRFSDQIDTNEKNSNPVIMNITDSVQIELWKRVFPKEFSAQSVRNSAFTPKMKCSLSSKTASSQGVPRTFKRPLNGSISVHVPATAIEEYVSPTTKARNSTDYPDESAHHNMEVKDIADSEEAGIELAAIRSLEKTPTDAEINSMWDQIRHCLQDGRKMHVPPRVFNFRPPTENGRQTLTNSYRTVNPSAAGPSLNAPMNTKLLSNGKTGTCVQSSNVRRNNMSYTTRKQLVYRQPNHSGLIRLTDARSQPIEATTQYAVPVRQEPGFKNRLLSNIQPSSKEPAKSGGTSNGTYVLLKMYSIEIGGYIISAVNFS